MVLHTHIVRAYPYNSLTPECFQRPQDLGIPSRASHSTLSIPTRDGKYTIKTRNDFQGKYPSLHTYMAMWGGKMIFICSKMVLTQLNKSTRSPISDATRSPPPDSLYIRPYSIRAWDCSPHHTTLTSPSSSKVTTTHCIYIYIYICVMISKNSIIL